MKVEDKLHLLKFFSAIFNTFLGILGVSFFGCAVWILFDTGSFVATLSSDVKMFAGCLFIIGLVALSVSAVGYAGAHLENRCLLLLDMIFLICIVLGQAFATFLLLLNQENVENILTEKVDAIISEYGNNTSGLKWKLLDDVQRYGQCCGRESHADWMKNEFILSLNQSWVNSSLVLPCSCFNSSDYSILPINIACFGNGSHYTEGCQDKILTWLKENIYTILGIDLGLLCIQVLQFIVTVYLFQNIGLKSTLRNASQLVLSEEIPEPDNNSPELNHGYLEPNHGYQEPNHGYQEPNLGYQEPKHGYPEPNHGFPEPNHGYLEPNHGYPEPNHGYLEPNHGYLEPNHGYPEPNHGYLEPNHGYQEPNHGYQEPNHGYQEPNLGYQEPNHSYQEPNFGNFDSNKGYPATHYAYSDQNQAVQNYAHLEPTLTLQNPNRMRF